MNIPLINSNSKQDINTSLIAIRNAINELARVKESESVEDLQRQINIINQQIASFNSEFSAINTHLNTIDTNILNLQPVDTVASGNLHSVTSNAVSNLNSLNNITIQNSDVLTIAENCLGDRVTFFRGFECTNSPLGSATNDFYYQVSRLNDSKWIKIIASDIRSNDVYFTTKINGVWGSWAKIQKLDSFTEYNVITSGTLDCGESFVSYKNGTLKLFARFFNYDTPTVIQENDIIGVITQSYLRPNEVIKMPCYSFGNQHTYFIQIFPNGNITIQVAGTSSPVPYDIYINAIYLK